MTVTARLRLLAVGLAAPAVLLVVQALVFPVPAGIYVQGVVLGVLGALVSVGMCLVYRANRIINFAQSSLGLVPTVVAVDLIVYSRVSFIAAALIGGALAVAVGLGLHAGIIARFDRSSRLILTAATIGIAQLCLGLSIFVPYLWGHETRAEEISSGLGWGFTVEPLVFKAEHVLAAVIGPVALGAVAVLLLRTRIGTAVRAAADRADRAGMLGIPVRRTHLTVWAGAALLSFTGVFLRVAIVGLPLASTESFTALLSALAALAIGRFTHLARVAATSVALGVVEQAVTWTHPENPNLFAVVLAAVIFAGLAALAAPGSRAARDTTSSWQALDEPRRLPAAWRRHPAVRGGQLVLVAVVVALAFLWPASMGSGDQLKAATVLVYALVGVSLVVLTGWAGQVSLGQMGFVAVGCAVGSWLTNSRGLDFSVGLVGSAIAGALAAAVVGLPALRLRGLFLAAITLAFGVATSAYLLKPAYAPWIPQGRVNRPKLFGRFDLSSEHAMYQLCLVVLLLVVAATWSARRGRPGRAFVAQRDNQLAAEGYGMSTTRSRLTAFSLSGGIAAVAGCLLVHLLQTYPDQLLTPDQGLAVFSAAVVGGIGSPVGAVIGAIVFVASGTFLTGFFRILPTSIGVLLVLLACPSGLTGAAVRVRNRLLRPWLPAPAADAAMAAAQATGRAAAGGALDVAGPPGDGDGLGDGDGDGGVDGAGRAPIPTGAPALRVRDLRVTIGDTVIIDGVSFDLAAGETLALLGTNGAGKSTVLNAVSGVLPVAGGSVEVAGTPIANRPPHRVAALGVGQAPGGRGVFPSLSVAENLDLAAWLHPRHDEGVATRRAGVLAAFPALEARLHEPAANLSGGEQQMLVMGMAFVAEPAVLMIDELSLGLAPIVVEQLIGFLERIREMGTSIIVVEQSLTVAAEIAERALFLERGQVAFEGPTAALLDQPELSRSVYLAGATASGVASSGGAGDGAGRSTRRSAGAAPPGTAIGARGASVRYGGVMAVSEVDLAVAPGEIVGLIGPNGAGKSTFLDALSGLVPLRGGKVLLGDRDVTARSFTQRSRLGLARSFQHAELFPSMTVEECLAVACDRSVTAPGLFDAILHTPGWWRSERAVRRRVDELVEAYGLADRRELRMGDLSTGQRRIVDLAAIVADRPEVVLLDEPSSGLAQAEVEALGGLLRAMHDDLDLTLVVVEHDIPLISGLADRLVVLDQGVRIAEGDPASVLADPRVVAAYLGTSEAAVNRSRST